MFVFHHKSSVLFLDDGEIFVFNVHVVSDFWIGRCCHKSMDDMHHFFIISIVVLVNAEHLLVVLALLRLVEKTQYFVEPIVDTTAKARDLHDDAVVCQTIKKGVGDSLDHQITVIVESMMVHIKNRFLHISNFVSKNIDCHHWQGIALFAFGVDIIGIGVLNP